MGWGDDVMSTAYAREAVRYAKERTGNDVLVAFGEHDPVKNVIRSFWSPAFENNPHIVDSRPGAAPHQGPLVTIRDHPGHRLYIDYERCDIEVDANAADQAALIKRYAYDPDFRAPRGELFFSRAERNGWVDLGRRVRGTVVVEPNVKAGLNGQNKAWPMGRWQELVNRLAPNEKIVQLVWGGSQLENVELVTTPSMRHAAYALRGARLFIGTDGGLHHTAAALGVPAVVLWSHYSSPQLLGYADHENVRRADGVGCGTLWERCTECERAMALIPVQEVRDAVGSVLAVIDAPETEEGDPA